MGTWVSVCLSPRLAYLRNYGTKFCEMTDLQPMTNRLDFGTDPDPDPDPDPGSILPLFQYRTFYTLNRISQKVVGKCS